MATTFVLVVVPTTYDASDACAYGVAWCFTVAISARSKLIAITRIALLKGLALAIIHIPLPTYWGELRTTGASSFPDRSH
jgi:hypothetical protein